MVKDKYPFKTEGEVNKMLEQIQSTLIDDWMWKKILEKMYEEKDAEILEEQIHETI